MKYYPLKYKWDFNSEKDLKYLDREVYESLIFLRDYSKDDIE
jgi:hypothetical protein